MKTQSALDAVVVGSGPNGLSAAIVLAQAGLNVLVLEAKPTIGGGARSAPLTLPGFTHDVCSAIYPLGAGSPFFTTLPLEQHGLKWVWPDVEIAHPLDNGSAIVVHRCIHRTAGMLGADGPAYERLIEPLVRQWNTLRHDILAPLHWPARPLALARFGLSAIRSATSLSERRFSGPAAQALFAGMAAHSMVPLDFPASTAAGLMLLIASHAVGWPMPMGGAQAIPDALASHLRELGGRIEVNRLIESFDELPYARAYLFDITPRQLLHIAGERFSHRFRQRLERYRYGMGVFKIDWALDGPIPWTAEACRRAGTVHLGATMEQIARSEQHAWRGEHSDRPYVLLAQQTIADPSRAPAGKHTAWAYCHVPHGSTADMTPAIEQQVERFAPGFSGLILARATMNTRQMEQYNPNYIGGDINGGAQDLGQLFFRPTMSLQPYATSDPRIFICSSSTPPGGGVHGMCGYHAAKLALRRIFRQTQANK